MNKWTCDCGKTREVTDPPCPACQMEPLDSPPVADAVVCGLRRDLRCLDNTLLLPHELVAGRVGTKAEGGR